MSLETSEVESSVESSGDEECFTLVRQSLLINYGIWIQRYDILGVTETQDTQDQDSTGKAPNRMYWHDVTSTREGEYTQASSAFLDKAPAIPTPTRRIG